MVELRAMVDAYPNHPDTLFLLGITLVEHSYNPSLEEEDREEFVGEAVSIFEGMLTKEPGAHRIHLELARAYFLQGEDSLAKDHFKKVLKDEPPSEVEKKVDYFLSRIKTRRPWHLTMNVGMIYDDNINKTTEQDTIYIFGLPFRYLNAKEAESGRGAILKLNGEYQHKIERNRLYWRVGGRGEWFNYENSNDYDQVIAEGYTGPRWLINRKNEVSLLAVFRRDNVGDDLGHKESELRLETTHRQDFAPGLVFNTQISTFHKEYHQGAKQDGKRYKGRMSFKMNPSVRARVKLEREYNNPETGNKNQFVQSTEMGVTLDLPLGGGMVLDLSREGRKIKHEGGWFPYVSDGSPRRDKVRSLRWSLRHQDLKVFGFRPELYGGKEKQTSNAQLFDYTRTFVGLNFSYQF